MNGFIYLSIINFYAIAIGLKLIAILYLFYIATSVIILDAFNQIGLLLNFPAV
ncbi:hypothetical protein XBFM1_750043 [Xenorhabdus bovienii str. feltiae Moldova]|uniref:Uncharacterized protein n=1 Tax=Xenorhabdus bovienii str. feltiae Moldova TaxID=1398200 RepID=A0A077NMJ9_XENBV|nr:hypothetical protein XBFM1_750043 [Xenorhabdus bovienii str. feltiae Moldova]